MRERCLDVGAACGSETFAGRSAQGQCGEALLGVTAVGLELSLRQSEQQVAAPGIDCALLNEQVGQTPTRSSTPGTKCRNKLVTGDQAGVKS